MIAKLSPVALPIYPMAPATPASVRWKAGASFGFDPFTHHNPTGPQNPSEPLTDPKNPTPYRLRETK